MMNPVPKEADTAVVCYIELCKAAIYVPPTITSNSLRTLAPDIVDKLKVLHLAALYASSDVYWLSSICSVTLWTHLPNFGHRTTQLT